MLRPQIRTHASHTGNARSPLIRPTDDDHPLLPSLSGTREQQRLSPGRAASQLDLLGSRELFAPASLRQSREALSKKDVLPGGIKDNFDTEVYVHEVTKTDTLPRIILQYRISVEVLRRANKLWANDSIQYKNVLLLPVSACAIQPNLIEDLPSSLVPSATVTQSSSISVNTKAGVKADHGVEMQRSASSILRTKKEKDKIASHKLHAVRQVYIDGVGLVDVACVPAASLSYFPPSKNPAARPSIEVSRYRDSFESIRNDKRASSFEIIRASAGQMAADAYNGTQGLIRRLKDKKHVDEIDLIEL